MKVGLYSPFFGSTVGGGEKYLGVTAEAIRDGFPVARVEIVSPVPADRHRYERMLALDLDGIGLVSTNPRPTALHRVAARMPALRLYRDLAVSMQAARMTLRYDIFLTMVYVLPAFSLAPRTVVLCQFPYERGGHRWRKGPLAGWPYWLYSAPYRALMPRLAGRDVELQAPVICQSEFVRHWVNEYWCRDAAVVNPPIDIPADEPDWGAKERIVLSVGRFFSGGHSKRHDVMVEAFRSLCDAGLEGWSLHLAGSVHRQPADLDYLARVKARARGYPVELHTDATYEEVQALYRRASVYWHAAGWSEEEGAAPITLEHFGMTTAEAMGHGAVPVVIARGGQPEVVSEGEDGFQWREPAELKARTMQLASSSELRERMGRAARRSSFRFSRPEFKRRMVERLRPLVEEVAEVPATG
ncbi:MAG: glycosyltransferase family 4 protein [Candidatus Dormibacterales bacterium]